jgi:hypothetical protein
MQLICKFTLGTSTATLNNNKFYNIKKMKKKLEFSNFVSSKFIPSNTLKNFLCKLMAWEKQKRQPMLQKYENQ